VTPVLSSDCAKAGVAAMPNMTAARTAPSMAARQKRETVQVANFIMSENATAGPGNQVTEAGVRLKRVLTIAEGGARPGPRKVFRAMALQDSAASVPVAAGEQTIRANVSVTYDVE
jgi:hypothetical protein